MGFKADLSFLAKLKMGATATRATMSFMADAGFTPIELERYSTSTKIWSTKVKRLRLPDLLCICTGLRVEVRGKSKLEVKMSDSPSNPERRWDSGSRDDDLVAFVPCRDLGEDIEVRGPPTFLTVRSMRASKDTAKLGPPKSASEGAERDLTWPSIVPSDDGTVVAVEATRVRVALRNGRTQSYQLRGKHCYVSPGDQIRGGASFVAGSVSALANIREFLTRTWNPLADLKSANATDRYVAAKALGRRPVIRGVHDALESALRDEPEARTSLEMAGAAARLGSEIGFVRLRNAVFSPGKGDPDYLRMEAVLILTELANGASAEVLGEIAVAPFFRGTELRQAAVWGLGKAGCKRYERLVSFLADDEDDFAMHVIAAFGSDVPPKVIKRLVDVLRSADDERARASAAGALRMVGTSEVAKGLLDALRSATDPWLIAALGSLPAESVEGLDVPSKIRAAIEPVRLIGPGRNWLASSIAATNFNFLIQQS